MKNNLFAACVVALGLALAGMFIYLGFRSNAQKDRAVVVKGLSTRDVQADYAVWPLSFGVHSNDLPAAYKDLNQVTETVKQFLIQKGFSEADLRIGNTTVQDMWSNYYGERRPDFPILSIVHSLSAPRMSLVSWLPKDAKANCSAEESSLIRKTGTLIISSMDLPNSSRL